MATFFEDLLMSVQQLDEILRGEKPSLRTYEEGAVFENETRKEVDSPSSDSQPRATSR